MTDLDPAVVAAIEARLAKATPGPWESSLDESPLYDMDTDEEVYVVQTEAVADVVCRLHPAAEFNEREVAHPRDDAWFIAHAPTDIRLLLDEVARLRAERDEAEAERDSVQFALDGFRSVARHDNAALLARAEAAERERDEALAKIESLRIGMDGARGNHDRARRALVARAEVAEAQVAAVRALADEAREWVGYADASPGIDPFGDAWMHTTILRGLAALAAPTGEGDGS